MGKNNVKNKINLLYVINSLANGGAETLAIRLAEGLNTNMFNAAVCSLSDQGPLRGVLEQKGVPFFTLGKREGKDFAVALRLRKLLKEQQVDIVHTHNQGPLLYTRLARLFCRGVRHVHTEHINMEKELSYTTRHRQYTALLYRSLDGFINIAEHLASEYRQKFDLTRAKLRTIHNCVECREYKRGAGADLFAELNFSRRVPVVGNISALRPQKDHGTLIRAMGLVVQEVPDALLVIAGEGESREELERLTRELRLEDHVIFLGYRADVDSLLAQFDIFVLSSLYEGLPLCLLEAMAAGKAIVATDADGNNEIIKDGRTGMLCPIGDHGKFAEAIIRLLTHTEQACQLGATARETALRDYDLQNMIAKYEQYYLELQRN